MPRSLLLAPALLSLMACGGANSNSASAAASPAAIQSGRPVDGLPGGLPFNASLEGSFDEPFAMVFLPDGRLLVTEKGGRLQLRATDGSVTEVTGVPPVEAGGQGGLLDVALAPDFATSHAVYLSYSEPGDGGSSLALARGRLAEGGGHAKLDGMTVLWHQMPKGDGGQFGAVIAFAPDGKSLFLASGERQRKTPAQDPDQALGKILHLTLDGKPAPGNPMYAAGGAKAVTWTTGHRNPYGLVFAADGRLWENEMGPKGGDELNLIEKGKNYGWPVVSNGINYDGSPIPDHDTHPEFAAPTLYWVPSISPAGAIIYTGDMFSAWKGNYILGALSGEALVRITLDGASAHKADQWDMGTRIRDIAQAADGAIWLLEDGGRGAGGRLMRLTPK